MYLVQGLTTQLILSDLPAFSQHWDYRSNPPRWDSGRWLSVPGDGASTACSTKIKPCSLQLSKLAVGLSFKCMLYHCFSK